MDITSLYMHNMRDGKHPAWAIEGATPDEEKRIIEILSPHMEYEQHSSFNEWWIIASNFEPRRFYVRRFTWEDLWFCSLDEFEKKIHEYYKDYSPKKQQVLTTGEERGQE